jgi:hypothetical protein
VKSLAVITMLSALPMLAACPPRQAGVSRTGTVEVAKLRCPEDALTALPGVTIGSGKEHHRDGQISRYVEFDTPEMKTVQFMTWHQGSSPMNLHIGVDGYRERQMTPDGARTLIAISLRVEEAIATTCDARLVMETTCHGDDLCAAVGAVEKKPTDPAKAEVTAS